MLHDPGTAEGIFHTNRNSPRTSPFRSIVEEDVDDDRKHFDLVPPLSNIPSPNSLFYALSRIAHDTYKPEGPP